MDRFLLICCLTAALGPAPPAGAALRPSTDMVLPSVAHAPGRLPGSEFHTDLWLFNPGEGAAEVEVAFIYRNRSQPAPPPVTLELAPGQVREVQDAVLALFGLTNAVGGFRFAATAPVAVTARVYDVGVAASYGPSSTGSSGQFDAATPVEDGIRAGETADIIGIRGVTQGDFPLWRTNVAFMNASAGASQVRVSILDEAGQEPPGGPASRLYTLGAWEPRQINDVFASLETGSLANGRVRVEVVSGGPVVAMGSLLDGRTNDPSTIVMAHGPLRDGTYVARQEKTLYDTPLAVTLQSGAIIHMEATLLITAEDVGPACQGGELGALSGALPFPVLPDEQGRFTFATSANLGGVTFHLELDLAVESSGRLWGTATTTTSGAGACSGTAAWPVTGARVP